MEITKEFGTLPFRKRPHSFTGNTSLEEHITYTSFYHILSKVIKDLDACRLQNKTKANYLFCIIGKDMNIPS